MRREKRVREARKNDLREILELYLHLHETGVPDQSEQLTAVWEEILRDDRYHLLVNEVEGRIVASCTCVVVPNLTRDLRPYALVENVVTRSECRGRGYATECLASARKVAEQSGCYKIMLMTGSKEEKTLQFYKNAGYSSGDKTAFVQWLAR